MRFEVSRVSQYGSEDPPCEEAVWEDHGNRTCVDCRSTDAPEKIPFAKGESAWWYQDGSNHRLVDGQIQRDVPVPENSWYCWTVEIEGLESLMAFMEKYGDLILREPNLSSASQLPEIKIYDARCE